VLADSIIVSMMEAAVICEVALHFYQTTRRYNQEESQLLKKSVCVRANLTQIFDGFPWPFQKMMNNTMKYAKSSSLQIPASFSLPRTYLSALRTFSHIVLNIVAKHKTRFVRFLL
jgi:hypothetical protein